jgi:hypothetical protein
VTPEPGVGQEQRPWTAVVYKETEKEAEEAGSSDAGSSHSSSGLEGVTQPYDLSRALAVPEDASSKAPYHLIIVNVHDHNQSGKSLSGIKGGA